MFLPIEGGSFIDVPDNSFGFNYRCHIPPEGYGQHSLTGAIKPTDVFKRSDIASEQFWEREVLPKDYKQRVKAERDIKRLRPSHIDPYLEEIRRKDWHRRMYGVWFWNNGQQVYLTGLNWLYITYWKFQGKFMDFRITDRDLFYVIQYCMEDDLCLGLNELTKRKNGKTARVGCWGYERVSRLNNHHGGLQSKSDDDAEGAFKKAIIHPWQKLPDHFRPRYDLMKGEEPNELRFYPTARRGERIHEDDNDLEEALESFFDYMPSTESAYDGPELHTYISDEAGKTKKPVSIKERQNVVRYCTEIDGIIQGKHFYTTTVEPEKGEEENYEFQELTANSNPLERDDNGMTTTGLYTYFLPAYKGMYFDKYGYPDEEKAKTFLANKIKDYENKNDLRGLSSFKRKNPQSFKEAFSADGEFALYNPELLNRQLDNISWTNKFTERGNLEWVDGYKVKRPHPEIKDEFIPSKVQWVPDANGKFEKVVGWFPREANMVFWGGQSYEPNNDNYMSIGCDPFRYDKTKDKRRSNCAAFAYQIKDNLHPDKYDDMFALRYAFREESTRLANEDLLKMAWWCGCKVLFERNVNHWKNDFGDWECARFLKWMPGELEPGIITAGDDVQTICNYTEAYINQHIGKVYFKSLIRKDTGWLGFKVESTESFDEPMAAGITLIDVKGKAFKNSGRVLDIQDYWPKYRTN